MSDLRSVQHCRQIDDICSAKMAAGHESNQNANGTSLDGNHKIARQSPINLQTNRRAILGATIMGFSLLTTMTDPANAKDEIFKPNPLTNPILEKVGESQRENRTLSCFI